MLTQKCPQRLQTATSSLWAIYMASPGYFRVAGDQRHPTHIEEHLQAIQVQMDQILRLSTSFVCVSARLAFKRVREQSVVPYKMVLEWSTIASRCAGLLGVLVARRHVNDPPAWCGVASTTLCGDVETPPFLVKLFIGNRDQGDRGDLVSLEETWLPRSNTLCVCFNNIDEGVPLWLTEAREKFSCQRIYFLSSFL